ncbi:hypothetical protein D3C80_1663810 [compost metagenome]
MSGPRGKQESEVRRLLCKAAYWLIEPLLDRLDWRRYEKQLVAHERREQEERDLLAEQNARLASAGIGPLSYSQDESVIQALLDSASASPAAQAVAERPHVCGHS